MPTNMPPGTCHWLTLWVCLLLGTIRAGGQTFRVAAYNVENYLDIPAANRPSKSPEARAAVRESILALKPDILSLEEMGSTNALLELVGSLKAEGLEFPWW